MPRAMEKSKSLACTTTLPRSSASNTAPELPEGDASMKAYDEIERLYDNRRTNEYAPSVKESWAGRTAEGLASLVRKLRERYLFRDYEVFYRRIGWWKGPFATSEARKSVRKFWVDCGAGGAEWLIERIGRETHGDLLDGVANVLADIGQESIVPIAHKLKYEPARDQAEVLLKSLGWIEATQDAAISHPQDLWTTLERYLSNPDADIRAAACAATRILPRHRARALLAQRRALELDPEVLRAIDESSRD
jgi:hypothetical protein